MTSGTGPWGALAFTYDKIGNRLSETRDAGGSPQNRPYAYPASPSGGNLPKLASITDPAGDRLERFFFDDAGNQTYRATQTAKHRLSYDALGRMSQIKTDSDETAGALVTLAYDGRSFLREATRSPFPGQPATVTTNPTYSSDGRLMHKATSEVLGPDDPRGEGTVASDAYVPLLRRQAGRHPRERDPDAPGRRHNLELHVDVLDHRPPRHPGARHRRLRHHHLGRRLRTLRGRLAGTGPVPARVRRGSF